VFLLSLLAWLSALIIWSVVSAVLLVVSLVFTSPKALGPLGVTVWFLLCYSSLGAIIALGFYGAKTFLHLHATGAARLRYSLRQGLLISGWVTGVLALSSLRQLGWLDAILLALLLLIVEVYVRLRWP
jgi:hypothetical protein